MVESMRSYVADLEAQRQEAKATAAEAEAIRWDRSKSSSARSKARITVRLQSERIEALQYAIGSISEHFRYSWSPEFFGIKTTRHGEFA